MSPQCGAVYSKGTEPIGWIRPLLVLANQINRRDRSFTVSTVGCCYKLMLHVLRKIMQHVVPLKRSDWSTRHLERAQIINKNITPTLTGVRDGCSIETVWIDLLFILICIILLHSSIKVRPGLDLNDSLQVWVIQNGVTLTISVDKPMTTV